MTPPKASKPKPSSPAVDIVIQSTLWQALPDVEPTLTFPVSWTGQDDAGGSGVGAFDVYVSDNGGPFTVWLDETTATFATFAGQTDAVATSFVWAKLAALVEGAKLASERLF